MRTSRPCELVLIGLLAPAAAAGEEGRRWSTRSEVHMATTISVTVPSDRRESGDRVFAAFAEVEATANEWRPESALGRVNAGAGAPVAAPDDVRALVRRGLELSALTDGAFDISWAALWGLWDFGAAEPTPPDPAEVAARARRVDHRRVVVDDAAGTIAIDEGMVLGVGGIAKGWALDRATAALRAHGVDDFALSAGGQIAVGGLKDGRPWRVGIRDPRGPADDWFALVEVSDVSVSTSGDYERWFEWGGTRWHHILDPRTGYPARGVRSATVIAAEATLADALSTALVVLGVRRGLALVERLPGVEAVLVDDDGTVWRSAGVELVTLHPPRP